MVIYNTKKKVIKLSGGHYIPALAAYIIEKNENFFNF